MDKANIYINALTGFGKEFVRGLYKLWPNTEFVEVEREDQSFFFIEPRQVSKRFPLVRSEEVTQEGKVVGVDIYMQQTNKARPGMINAFIKYLGDPTGGQNESRNGQ